MLERAFRGSAAGARHLSELYANAGQLRESWHREYSNRSRDRKGALGLWATQATLPSGRGSDWGFLLVHFYVAHPSAPEWLTAATNTPSPASPRRRTGCFP